MLDELLNTGTS